jgi:hypothetical protein
MNHIFIGKKTKPSFLLEFNKKLKTICVYKPDKYSIRDTELEFFEKYSLGKLVTEIDYDEFIITKDPLINFKDYYYYTPEILVKSKNDYILINKSINKLNC